MISPALLMRYGLMMSSTELDARLDHLRRIQSKLERGRLAMLFFGDGCQSAIMEVRLFKALDVEEHAGLLAALDCSEHVGCGRVRDWIVVERHATYSVRARIGLRHACHLRSVL